MKKIIKKIKAVLGKKAISNDEFLQSEPQTFSNEICKQCNGQGLARPTFVNSEFCGNCKGTGREPITE